MTMFVRSLSLVAMMLGVAAVFTQRVQAADEKKPASAERFFEMRKYYAAEGKLDDLNTRFRDHTNALFAKHDITIIGFWVPSEGAEANKVLVYILAYPSKEAHDKSWKDFNADPDWIKAKTESELKGKLVNKVESTFMKPTDYSPIK